MPAVEVILVDPSALDGAAVLRLYDAVGWAAYTRDPDTLFAALAGSSTVAVASSGGQLIGLARAVSDGASICYLQDILVAPEHQQQGIGARLARAVLDQYQHVRQKVLLTDDEPGQAAFYRSLGYLLVGGDGAATVRSYVRFD